VNGILDDLSNLIKETNTIIKVNSLPTIMTYDAEFSQLLQNLISNAIKFRKEGVPCEISINCKELEEFWQFEVIDNGIGIDEMNQRRIFDIFQQLHKKGSYEGYGIGLANCKKIVEQHGGEIWVESEIGKGSTFYFTIKNLET
jgi:signal transduction histidine kinase